MEPNARTLIQGEIYFSCGENSCKPKRIYAQLEIGQETNSQKEKFHLALSDVKQKKRVKKMACWGHRDFCGIVDGDLTIPVTGCWTQKSPKMTYVAVCLQGKTIMLFSKEQQQQPVSSKTLKEWKQTLFRAMKCVNTWYVTLMGSTAHITGLEVGSQVTLALTASGLSLLNNSSQVTSRPPHGICRWSLSRIRCELQGSDIIMVYATGKTVTEVYTFRTKHSVAVVIAVEAARDEYLRSCQCPSSSSSSETTSQCFTESFYDETKQSQVSTESEQDAPESIELDYHNADLDTVLKLRKNGSTVDDLDIDDDKRNDELVGYYDLTFSRRSRSTGCLASITTINDPKTFKTDGFYRRSYDNLFAASCSCNINDMAADMRRLQNPKAIYSQMDTIVRTAAVHCNSLTPSGVIETVLSRTSAQSTRKKRFAKPVGSLTLSVPPQSVDDSQSHKTLWTDEFRSMSSSVSRYQNRFSLYRSISEQDVFQPQSPGNWIAESICRCLNDVLNNHPPLPDTLRLPYKLRIQLCMRLYTLEDNGQGWKALAEKIGLNYDAVMIIQSFQQHHPCQLTAAEIVLRHWQSVYNHCAIDPLKCPVACTRDTLTSLLQQIGRLDLVDLLR